MDPPVVVALLALGAVAGFAAGLMGVGGGMLMVPFMSMLLDRLGFAPGQAVKVAIATSLTTIVFTSVSSVRAHHGRAAVRWDVVRSLAPGIVAGALVGAQVAGALPGRLLAAGFGAFLAWSALKMLRSTRAAPTGTLPGPAGMFGAGSAIGAVSAVLGAGGGFLTVPFLVARRVPVAHAVGTSAACGFPIALAGALGYVWAGRGLPMPPATLGFVYLPALAVISAASMLTAPLGARAAHALPEAAVKRVFAALLAVLASYMLVRAARG